MLCSFSGMTVKILTMASQILCELCVSVVSFGSYHNSYQSTMELFYSKVTMHKSVFFNMKQYLPFSWGNIILNHAQSQGLHQRSIYVSVGASTSDVLFPC